MNLSLDHNIRAGPRMHSRAPPGSPDAKTADDGFGPDHRSEQRRPG